MTRIDAVVFDIGNVLIEWQPERFFDRRIGSGRRRALFAQVPLEAMNHAIDLGAPLVETVAGCAAKHPGWSAEINLWARAWLDISGPAIPGAADTLLALRARGVTTLALSNFGNEPFALALGRYPFLDAFDRRFLSGALGCAKPDPAIYATLERETGIDPQRLLFTDDRPENIAAAQARGWQTHLFRDPDGWAERLHAEGLLKRDA